LAPGRCRTAGEVLETLSNLDAVRSAYASTCQATSPPFAVEQD
jgi:hypothetical protein